MWIKRWSRFLNWQDGRVENKMDLCCRHHVSKFRQKFKDFKIELAVRPGVIMLKVNATPYICLAALNAL